jgi:GNAT superfamily N-acetyltransferase
MLIRRHTLAIDDRFHGVPRGDRASVNGVQVGPADQEGAEEAIDLLVRACRVEDGGMAGRLSATGLRSAIADRPGRTNRVWVARAEGGDPIGLVCLTRVHVDRGPRFSLSWLLVHPRWRRRGVGRRLVDAALLAAHRAGARDIDVETRSDWPDAAGFWARVAEDHSASASRL